MAITRLAQLVLSLKDDMSRGAKAAQASLEGLRGAADKLAGAKSFAGLQTGIDKSRISIREMAKELANAKMGGAFSRDLEKLKVAPREFDQIRRSWSQLQAELSKAPGGRKAFTVLHAEGSWRRQQLSELVAHRAEIARIREESAKPISFLRRGARFGAAAAGVYGGGYIAQRAARGTAIAGASDQRETFRQGIAGLSPEDIAKISAAADGLAGTYASVSRTDIRELARGARNLTGSVDKGLQLLPDIVRTRIAIQSATGGNGDGDLDQILKSADIAGLQDNPARFKAFLESFAKATQVEGKQINAGDYLSFYRRAKMAGSGFNDEFIASAAPSLIQEMGGPTAGTALATFFQQMAGGRAKKETLKNQREAGLRGDDGVLVDRQAFIANPFDWSQKHLLPLLAKNNVDQSDPAAMIDFLLPLFSERNAAEIASKFILQREQISRNQRMYAGAKGLDAAEEARTADPYVAATGALNSLSNAAAALAAPAVPAATRALNGFTDIMNGMATSLGADPELAKKASTIATGAVAGAGIVGSARAAMARWQGGGVAGAIGQGLRGAARGGILGSLTGGLLSPIMALRDAGEIKRPMTPTRHRMDQEIGPDAWERSRRVRDEMLRDPEGSRGRAFSRIGTDAATPESYDFSPASAAGAGQEAGTAAGQGVASGLAAQAPAVEAQAIGILDRIKSLFGAGVNVPVSLNAGSATDGSPAGDGTASARASGGTVHAGGVYRVNEYGQELFQPAESGTIIDPRRKAASFKGGSAGSPTFSAPISITVNGNADVQALASQVASELETKFSTMIQGAYADYGVETA